MRLRSTIAMVVATAAIALMTGTAGAQPPGAKVIKRAVTFQVRNLNGSILPCAADGSAYEVKGHLVGPESVVGPGASAKTRAVTLYLHDLSFGEFFWSFTAVPRYDYAAAMARAGHASVVIDRLGYGASGHPPGNQTCLGAQADVAHQIIGKLRSGDYAAEGGSAPRFDKVALAGHSTGALIANLEAISFKDADALVAMGYTPQVTRQAFEDFYASRAACDAGGDSGYAYIAATDAEFQARVFGNAEPAVKMAATRLRTRDPCGDGGSIIGGLLQDLKSLGQVKVPVLIVCGRDDAVTPSFACPVLKRRYTGSSDVSLSFLAKTGHAFTLERTAPTFRRRVGKWLGAHGF
jgi:pimeloyl-ACP methyl ester carboxylesterase